MKLTEGNKKFIDCLSYIQLLRRWRHGSLGSAEGDDAAHWLEGETGEYWKKRMSEMKNKESDGGVSASKTIGF